MVEMLDHARKSEDNDLVEWKYKSITAHKGILQRSHLSCNSSPCNLRIKWENWEVENDPMNIIVSYDHVSCATCARDNIL